MLLLTLFAVTLVPLVLELGLQDRFRRWPALRWGVLPPLGVLLGALFPMNVLWMQPVIDDVLSMGLGAIMGTLVAIYGLFRSLLFTGPTPADIARSGRRSAYIRPARS